MKCQDNMTYDQLIRSILARDLGSVKERLINGANPNLCDEDGRTPLIHAAIDGLTDIAKVLVDAEAIVNAHDRLGYTALHYAAQGYHEDTASMLIAAGACVDVEDVHGNTPLGRAVFESKGRGNLISLLLRAGADRNHPNKHGQTPLGLAKLIGNYNVAQFFE